MNLSAVDGTFQLRLKSVGICSQWYCYSEVAKPHNLVCACVKYSELNIYRFAIDLISSTEISLKKLLSKQLNVTANVRHFQSLIF
jgi:hypothetical protein